MEKRWKIFGTKISYNTIKGGADMKLNLLEKIIVKIFNRTFKKVYEKGLEDSFNFMAAPTRPIQKII